MGGGVYRVGGGVTAPAVLYKIDPEYSEEARKAKYSGTVVLYIEVDQSDKFAMPGCADAHSHVGGTGPDGSRDINEMVYQTNPELRVLDVIRPNNDQLKVAVAGGVTTITFIPGSGTNMGGWGALMKTGPGKLEDVLIRFPGVLKIVGPGSSTVTFVAPPAKFQA